MFSWKFKKLLEFVLALRVLFWLSKKAGFKNWGAMFGLIFLTFISLLVRIFS